MNYTRIEPDEESKHFVECYWLAESDDPMPRIEKIIPDGFTEIIFHFGDAYRIKFGNHWEPQSPSLVAGQIKRHFFLENCGRSNIFGIKLKATALAKLFSLNMRSLTDRVVDLNSLPDTPLRTIGQAVRDASSHEERIRWVNTHLKNMYSSKDNIENIDRLADFVTGRHGMVTVNELVVVAGVGERQLENLFSCHIGLSPKKYSQIIRFNYLFELLKHRKPDWHDLAYEAAYYDQSHFIRNFRNFTGENPTDYAFDEKNLANFFLQRK